MISVRGCIAENDASHDHFPKLTEKIAPGDALLNETTLPEIALDGPLINIHGMPSGGIVGGGRYSPWVIRQPA